MGHDFLSHFFLLSFCPPLPSVPFTIVLSPFLSGFLFPLHLAVIFKLPVLNARET